HRAFSVFIFNTKGQLLIQQRADTKYHSAGLWSNTCCSHPQFGEEMQDPISRRLKEEMGMKVPVKFAFSFIYKITFENGLTEHEFDHVYFGTSDELPLPDPEEVKAFKYVDVEFLKEDLNVHPDNYTEWLRLCF